MINVAFTAPQSREWMGGVSYHKNLFFAISQLDNKQICPIVFLGKNTDKAIIDLLRPHAKIILDSLFDTKSIKFKLASFIAYYLSWPVFHNRIFEKHDIDVAHHVYGPYKGLKFKTVSWIPDFQHVHLPGLFTKRDVKERNKSIKSLLQVSNATILSSHDAYRDCLNFEIGPKKHLHILQFVSQPNPEVFNLKINFCKDKYDLPQRYFYLPNQFWKHKNHLQVFKAVKQLKNLGLDVTVVCSGSMHDYRHPQHIEEIRSYIKDNKLEKNIILLSLIDYLDVLYLMRFSVSVINPSLFEGWSSTVEECKSIGKNMILSDLNVHKEQNPAESSYFELTSPTSLENLLKNAWLENKAIPNIELEKQAAKLLPIRTREFAEQFQLIILSVMSDSANSKES